MAFDESNLTSPLLGSLAVTGAEARIKTGADSEVSAGITIGGQRACVDIGARCVVRGWMTILGDDVTFRIGDRTTLSSVSLQAHEKGNIVIGEDCQLSTEIMVSVSDMHPIFDTQSGERINPAADIILGDHVWVGFRCIILKGARIGSGSVIGAGSVVHGEIPEGVIAAGNPARVIRRNIGWRRSLR